MGDFKQFWIFGYERWGLRPYARENSFSRWKPLVFGLWVRVPKRKIK